MDKNKLKYLTPFKCCIIQNFPFIEEDFDAITNYQLLCKVVEYLNNTITAVNADTAQVSKLTDAFNDLKDYIDNYFNKLDVQSEINKKLDLMATDGTLYKIINQQIFGEINNKIAQLQADNIKHVVVIGDSFSDNTYMTETFNTKSWVSLMNIKNVVFHNYAEGGSGFTNTGIRGKTFVKQLEQAIKDLSTIDYIIVEGGYNDKNCSSWVNSNTLNDIVTASDKFRSVYNTITNKPPMIVAGCNAGKELTIYEITYTREMGRYWITRGFPFIKIDRLLQWNNSLVQSDNVHPSAYGENLYKSFFSNILFGGNCVVEHTRTNLNTILGSDFNLELEFTSNGSYHVYGSVAVDNLEKGNTVVITTNFPTRFSDNKLIANIVGTLGYLGRIEIERNKISYYLLKNTAGNGLVDFYYSAN